jgi:DNA polymerase-2
LVQDVKAGKHDKLLVYRKGLRKTVDEYTDHAPPHVQAARLLKNPGSHISYVITVEGPQPRSAVNARLDYDHYIEAQLRPVADAILDWVNLDFDSIVSGQTDLFGRL